MGQRIKINGLNEGHGAKVALACRQTAARSRVAWPVKQISPICSLSEATPRIAMANPMQFGDDPAAP
jgi:hypothetical protein